MLSALPWRWSLVLFPSLFFPPFHRATGPLQHVEGAFPTLSSSHTLVPRPLPLLRSTLQTRLHRRFFFSHITVALVLALWWSYSVYTFFLSWSPTSFTQDPSTEIVCSRISLLRWVHVRLPCPVLPPRRLCFRSPRSVDPHVLSSLFDPSH